MYSKEELSSKKYGDLLKILKKLGVKGGRLKTEKVIELILEHQDTGKSKLQQSTLSESKLMVEENEDNSISTHSAVTEDKSEIVSEIQSSPKSLTRRRKNITINGNRRTTRSSVSNLSINLIDDVDSQQRHDNEKRNSSANDESFLNLSKSLSRSNTFVLEDGLPDDSLTESLDVKPSLKRSSTFTLEDDKNKAKEEKVSPSLKRSSTFTLEDDKKKVKEEKVPTVSPVKNMDLSCSEVQTFEDIENIESGVDKDAPFLASPSIMSSKKKTMRRSLRGQLLESKMYLSGSLLASLPETNPEVIPENNNSLVKEDSCETFKEENFNIPKSFEFGKKNNAADKTDKSSGIPRFVSYARKLKMPNFARIHENAFNKMEALDDYVDRKHSRTKSMIETAAVSVGKKEFGKHEKKNLEKSKLKLNFTDSKALQLVTNQSTSSRSPGSVSKRRSSTSGIQTTGTTKAESSARKGPATVGKACALPRLVKENLPPPQNNPFSLWNKPHVDSNTPGSFQRRKSYVPTPPKSKSTALITKREVSHMAMSAQSGISISSRRRSREDKGVSRKEALKRATNRKPNVKSSAEIRASEKVFIKGVRTNRRFELQMANRGMGPN